MENLCEVPVPEWGKFVEHDAEQAADWRKRGWKESFHGVIFVGGLDEEMANLREYMWPMSTEDQRDYCAMGFEAVPEDDDALAVNHGRPADVAEWLWGCVKAEYSQVAERAGMRETR